MDTLTLVLLIYFIAVHSIWLTALICLVTPKIDKLVNAMLFVAIAVTVPYIGLFVVIDQFSQKRKQTRRVNEETNEETNEENE